MTVPLLQIPSLGINPINSIMPPSPGGIESNICPKWSSLHQSGEYAVLSASDRFVFHGKSQLVAYPFYTIEDKERGRTLYCSNVHFSTGQDQHDDNLKRAQKIAQEIKAYGANTMVSGDFNVYCTVEDPTSSQPVLSKATLDLCHDLAVSSDHVVIIPRGVVRAVRPGNLFKNAQALYKQSEHVGETMFLLLSKEMFDEGSVSLDDHIVFHPDFPQSAVDPHVQIHDAFSDKAFTDHLPIHYDGMAFVNLANVLDPRKGFIESMFVQDPTVQEQEAFTNTLVTEIGNLIQELHGYAPSLEDTKALSQTRVLPTREEMEAQFWGSQDFRIRFVSAIENFVDRLFDTDVMKTLLRKLKVKWDVNELKNEMIGVSLANRELLKAPHVDRGGYKRIYPKCARPGGILSGLMQHNNFYYASNAVMRYLMISGCSGYDTPASRTFESPQEVAMFQLQQISNDEMELIIGCECKGITEQLDL